MENYEFDPSQIVQIIQENPQIGLAIVQLPIALANALMSGRSSPQWKDYPTLPGYYWLKMNGSLSIKEYSSTEIDAIISLGNPRHYKYAGPLEPPK
jgi:hypothetical protein